MSLSGNKIPLDQAAKLRECYRASLLDDVVPWWMKHSLDREFGGYYSLLERDGRLWGTDKYIWMNGRQLWMLSHLFNTHEQKSEWCAGPPIFAPPQLQRNPGRGFGLS